MLIALMIVNFKCDDLISASDQAKQAISAITGLLLETSTFIYTCILPLKIAKGITDLKLRSFSRELLDPNTHSFVGTVVGVLLGATLIIDTIVFSNINFLLRKMTNPDFILSFLCILIAFSIIAVYKELKRELLKIRMIRKCFPKKLRSYTKSNIIEN